MSKRLRATVLISGSGTNLQALIDAVANGRLEVVLVHVISIVASAAGLARADKARIPASILEHGAFESRDDFDRALSLLIAVHSPDLIVLAGFMRIIGPALLDAFPGRMINLHPSLLPLYRGTRTYQRALDAGEEEHGASIHFVTEELDGGPWNINDRRRLTARDDCTEGRTIAALYIARDYLAAEEEAS